MNKQLLMSMLGIVGVLAAPVLAQPVTSYLEDESDAAVRVEIVAPPEIIQQEQSFFSKLRSFLGIRRVTRTKLPIGTKLTVQSSAYASSPYQTDSTPCVTAAGTRVRPGVVATNFLPLGAILEINGEQYIVEDRMNSRYDGYYLDIWFPSTSSALEFGRRSIDVTVVGYGEPGQAIREEAQKQAEADAEDDIVDVAVEQQDPSVWDNVRLTLANFTNFIGARVNPNVNRYDVDCLGEE